jgi:ribosomal protein S27AE
MSLIKCKECGNEVSSKAKSCPKCGAQVARKPIGCGSVIIFFFLLFLVGIIVSISRRTIQPNLPTNTISSVTPTPTAVPELNKVENIVIRGRSIAVGDTFDSAVEVLNPSDMINQSIHRDGQNNMTVMKYYDVEGKKFCLTVTRIKDPGPYIIVLIDIQ